MLFFYLELFIKLCLKHNFDKEPDLFNSFFLHLDVLVETQSDEESSYKIPLFCCPVGIVFGDDHQAMDQIIKHFVESFEGSG